MKILEEGKIPDPPKPFWVGMVLICGSCKTKIELEVGDRVYSVGERKMGANQLWMTTCPLCKGTIILNKLPNDRF